jgi:hypothetical protein
MLSVAMLSVNSESCCAECRKEAYYAERRYAGCRGAQKTSESALYFFN